MFKLLLQNFIKVNGRSPNAIEMLQLKFKAASQANKGKVIQFPQKRNFAEEIKAMMDDGTIKVGQVDKKNDNVLTREMFKNSNLNKPTIEGQMEKITGASNKIKQIQKEQADMYKPKSDAEIKAKLEKQNKDAVERIKKKKEDDPEFYTGGIVDVEPSLSDIGHGSDALMARTRLVSPGNQATTSTGLNYLLAEDNDNLRVPFSDGEFVDEALAHYNKYLASRKARPPKKKYKEIPFLKFFEEFSKENRAEGGRIGFAAGGGGRRAFLKLLATLTGGVAAAKSGILSLGGKESGKQVAKEVVKSAGTSGNPPPYFFKLVEKIRTMGDDTLATQDKAIAKKYKDYVMEEDFAGNIQIIKKDMDNPYPEEVIMSYKVDDVALKNKKGFAKAEEYEEFTVRPDGEGKMKDIESGVPDEVVNEGSVFEDNMTEFGMTKKADGGRIGFASGKLAQVSGRRFLEKVFGKQKFQTMIDNDPELEQGMLEVVDMFRKKDKEGLKMYMQKFLPHMDDEMVEDFIIGSGDIAGIEGQLLRLGSGRDYQGKIQMMKEAENFRKLEDFDIEGVSKNAEGGRIELRGGGDALKAIINYFAKQAGKKGSDQLRDINPKVLDSGIANIMGPEHMNMLKKNQTDYLDSLLSIIKSDKQFLDNVNKRVLDMKKNAPEGFEDVSESIGKQMVRSFMKDSRFDRMKVYDKIDIDDAIVDVEQMIKNRRVQESDGRALNASGGLQTMLGE